VVLLAQLQRRQAVEVSKRFLKPECQCSRKKPQSAGVTSPLSHAVRCYGSLWPSVGRAVNIAGVHDARWKPVFAVRWHAR
jgi:hypothetical protein